MAHLTLGETQVESEREVVANERRFRVEDDVDGFLNEELYKAAFTTHPYHWPTIGWMRDIEAISIEDCRQLLPHLLRAQQRDRGAGGRRRRGERARAHRASTTAKIPSSQIPPDARDRRAGADRASGASSWPKPVTADKLRIGYKAPAIGHADYATLEVASEILFGGNSSRLHRKLVVDTEIASSAHASTAPFRDPGLYEDRRRACSAGMSPPRPRRLSTTSSTRSAHGGARAARARHGEDAPAHPLLARAAAAGGQGRGARPLRDDGRRLSQALRRRRRLPARDGGGRGARGQGRTCRPERRTVAVASPRRARKSSWTADGCVRRGPGRIADPRRGEPRSAARARAGRRARRRRRRRARHDGLTNFASELMGRGAGGRTRAEIDAAFDALGTSLDVSSDYDGVTFDLTVLKEKLEAALALLADVILRPDFPTRRGGQAQARAAARQLDELARRRRLAGAPLLHARALRRASLRAHGHRHRSVHRGAVARRGARLAPARARRGGRSIFGVAGDVDAGVAAQAIARHFAALPSGGGAEPARAADGDAAQRHAPDARRQARAHAVADPHGTAGAALARSRLPRAAGGDHRVRRHLHGAPDGRGALQARPVVRRLGARRPGARRQGARGARVPVAGADAGDARAGAALVARVGRPTASPSARSSSRAAIWPRASPSPSPRPRIGSSCAPRSSSPGMPRDFADTFAARVSKVERADAVRALVHAT